MAIQVQPSSLGTSPYVELHCHSAYSFLDGVSLPDELAHSAAELGHVALALTDHNSVSGSMELAQVAKDAGVRAIHGAEVDLAPDPGGGTHARHLTLLVRDARGWRNLCRILTLAHAGTREGSGRERTEPSVALQTVLDRAEGLVCLTGCAERGVRERSTARRLLDAFGPQGLWVELQRPYARHDRARNRALATLARELGVKCVATGNVHAHTRSRAELQDAFVALRNHMTLDASEPLRRGNHTHVMSSPQAMAARFADHPEAVRQTLCLAEQLSFDLTKDLGYSYPGSEDESAPRRLAELCWARLEDRYKGGTVRAEAQVRLGEELRVIERLGLAGFFLLHHDMLELAREVAVQVRGRDTARALLAPGRGRGSSVSSIVCYLTGLSHIDPIKNGLLLGRFLHEDLHGLPDIDLDFPRDIREILIPRVHERYGDERAALVAAFPTFRARGAIRELGKVLGLPPGEIERIARMADGRGDVERDVAAGLGGVSLEGSANASRTGCARLDDVENVKALSARWRWLARLVGEAYRLPRHLSQHSGGMVVSTRPLIDCCPVVPSAMEGRQMVQWDKDSCADAGFLKIDLLGLGMLSAVERCVEEIASTRGERVDLSRIPFDDPNTFKAIRAADTVGVFQIESRAQMQSLRRTLPRTLDDLTVQVAIVRPGPIQGGAINPYIERLGRLREDPNYRIPYEHQSLEPVLQSTLGTIIFQDQVMQVAEEFAGFSPGEAEGLRRAMSRKRSEEAMNSHRKRFIAGAMRHVDASAQTAERVWEMVAGFAGFGFPKAHAAAFGLLAYQSTWLRVHYGPEFLCALLNEQPMGFYAPDSLVHEAQRRGIVVLGLDVNASDVQCTVERGAVRLGLGYVKGVGADEARELVDERERGGRFRDLCELAARAATRRGTLEQLAWAGACDSLVDVDAAGSSTGRSTGDRDADGKLDEDQLNAHRRVALWQLGIASPGEAVGDAVQLALPIELPRVPHLRPLDRWQRVLADYATSGVTVDDHVMAVLRPRLSIPSGADPVVPATSAELSRLPHGCSVAVAGMTIARQRPGTAKGTMFLLFEDEWGTVNLVVSGAVYERHRELARAEPLLLAHGRLERSPSGVLNVIVSELTALERFLASSEGEDARAGSAARVSRLPGADRSTPEDDQEGAEMGADMRAVAPPIQSFASGRRR
ncbi:MAG TPA: DNA polymerase III subunit alpha [Solirubrobacteraceae bacterium]|jgi:error-prone DNA polymerase|nr:DNA polymerase III subunit alpha [Solirubrobacteraceae bacterium]